MHMRIGIDCRTILHPRGGEGAGVGHYLHHLLEALFELDHQNEYVLFFDSRDAAEARHSAYAHLPNVRIRLIPFSAFRKYLPFVHRHIIVSAAFEQERLDLLHGPAGYVPLFYRRPWVVTVHDLAIYDHPEWFPLGPLGTQSFSTRILTPHSAQHARRVIAVSETTKNDIIRHFEIPADRIDVILEGAAVSSRGGEADEAISATLAKHTLTPGRYALFLGTIEPRKNIPLAIRAFARAVRENRLPQDAELVIAGKVGWKEGETFTALRAAQRELGDRVRYIGYLPTDDKHAVLASARVFLFPTRYEGFGLPMLESMQLGVPVVATDTAATREVCADAALIVPQDDESAFVAALVDAWSDGPARTRLMDAGPRRAGEFSWSKAAQATLRAYRQATETKVTLNDHDA